MAQNDRDGAYFDEAYFQRGAERGTAYHDYLTSAVSSPTFQEVARCIAIVFKPTRALEIGCATGPIVSQLNMLGVETHGIDVSDWAVRNALHPNVKWASADALPFPDNHFDFVYSSHALEHLPTEIFERAFQEISRVCTPDAFQFHMLPIIGTYPYDYDEATAKSNLKKDPTHNLLNDMDWWLNEFEALGWNEAPQSINFRFDTESSELSSGQFCIYRGHAKTRENYLKNIAHWNQLRFREIFLALRSSEDRLRLSTQAPQNDGVFTHWIGPNDNIWDDLKANFDIPIDATNGIVNIKTNSVNLRTLDARVALLSTNGGVSERWITVPEGVSAFSIDTSELSRVSGELDLTRIRAIYFGGVIGPARISANISLKTPHGQWSVLFD